MQDLFTPANADGPISASAEFSACRKYRYVLWRHWDWQGFANCVMFIGLNPSTADETQDDPTIRRCKAFAKSWGYGGMYMMNLFAWRATRPADMMAAADPVGPQNDEWLSYYETRAGLIVAAWGVDGGYRGRDAEVRRVLRGPVYCLGKTKSGQPRHPLYVPGNKERELLWHS